MTLYGTRRALLRPRRRFVDTFDALLSRWQTVAGTLLVDGGALKASALGDWGNNLITNGEFGADTAGWAAGRATIARVDSAADPGAASGGADNWAVKATVTDASGLAGLGQAIASILGGSYRLSARAYYPTGGAASLKAWFLAGGPSQAASTPDAWQTLTVSGVAATSNTMNLYAKSELGAVAYFDKAECYRQNAGAIMPFAPAFRARLTHISPAAPSVVPAGWMFRYTNALNYWELRLLPNTAGNDLQIVQVTAGVDTVRAEADVDWTAGGSDEVELIVRGSTITTRYRKAGGVWTAGPSYASATQGAQARAMGPLVYGATTARWARAEVDW